MKKDKIINKLIYRFSYYDRQERNLKETTDNINKYMKMSDDEFIMEYTEICSRYEDKKLIFIVISIGFIISIITNVWTCFYKFLIKLLTSENVIVINLKNQFIVLLLIIILMIFIVAILILYDMVKTIHVLNKKKIFLNQIK